MNYYNEFDPKAAAWLRELIAQGLIPAGIVDTRSIIEIQPHELKDFTQCHFFAGIAGWSLALQLAGWPPTRPVWTGSCPCQPFSTAGKQLAQSDERHLWPVFFNLIRECRPDVVFGEQVAAAIGKGWLDGVSADLEGAGYACGASVIGAHSVGSPHIRQRLYWVADSNGLRSLDGQHPKDGWGPEAVTKRGGDCGLVLPNRDGREQGSSATSTSRHRRPSQSDGGDGWRRVSFAADCLGGDGDEPGDECSICGLDYSNGCQCPGPTQDGIEYAERDGILYGRRLADTEGRETHTAPAGRLHAESCGSSRMGHAFESRLEGHTGNGDHGNQPGRLGTDALGPVATASRDSWSRFDLIPCADGKARRIEPGLAPLAHGVPARVVRLRGYGNAIVPQVAAEFVSAYLDTQNWRN
jgi:DNA (cytosine-5)-methyltransferase 1